MITPITQRFVNPYRGDLVYIDARGNRRVVEHDKPFGVLQNLRKSLAGREDYRNGKLRVSYPEVAVKLIKITP